MTISPLGLRDPRAAYTRPAGRLPRAAARRLVRRGGPGRRRRRPWRRGSKRPSSRRPAAASRSINAGVAGYGPARRCCCSSRRARSTAPGRRRWWCSSATTSATTAIGQDPQRGEPSSRPTFELDSERDDPRGPGHDARDRRPIRAASLRACCLLYNVFETGVLLKLGDGPVRDQPEFDDDGRYLVRSLYEKDPDPEMVAGLAHHRAAAGPDARPRPGPRTSSSSSSARRTGSRSIETAWLERMGAHAPRAVATRRTHPSRLLGEIAGKMGVPYVDLMPILATHRRASRSTSRSTPTGRRPGTRWSPRRSRRNSARSASTAGSRRRSSGVIAATPPSAGGPVRAAPAARSPARPAPGRARPAARTAAWSA